MAPPSSTVERLLDPSWNRVDQLSEAGPSDWLARQQATLEREDGMQVDGEDVADDDSGYGSWEYSDEEELITLDLGPDTQRIVRISDELAITGLETPTPFLQLGSLMFKGTWDKLIGTEILLRQEEIRLHDDQDEGDAGNNDSQGYAGSSGSGEQRGSNQSRGSNARRRQQRLRPLPASDTDVKRGTAPSTTRHRIQFVQASNLAKKEADLSRRARARYETYGVDGISEALRNTDIAEAARKTTGLVERKGHVWIRGYGWVRKEKTPWLREIIYGDINDVPGNNANDGEPARGARGETAQGRAARPRPQTESPDTEQSPAEGRSLLSRPVRNNTAELGPDGRPKRGRPRASEESKALHAIYMGLRRFHSRRNEREDEGEEPEERDMAEDGNQDAENQGQTEGQGDAVNRDDTGNTMGSYHHGLCHYDESERDERNG